MAVFKPEPTPELAARVAAIEAQLQSLGLTVGDNAGDASQALSELAAQRQAGDASAQQAVQAEQQSRVAGDQANADRIANEVVAREQALAILEAKVDAGVGSITTTNGASAIERPLKIGAPDFYEMNAGGQPVVDPALMQVADLQGRTSLIEGYRFKNDAKAALVQLGKNRGTGIPGPNFGRRTLSSDRLVTISFYAGKESVGAETAFAHAGYLHVLAEEDQDPSSNLINSYIQLIPQSRSVFSNGFELNSKSQVAFAGPMQMGYGPGVDHLALVRVGPPGPNAVAVRLTPSPLKADPVEGGLELDQYGRWWLTAGVTGSLSRRSVSTDVPNSISSVIPATGTATWTSGPGWAQIIITVGASDHSLIGTICSIFFDNAFPAVPIVVGARDTQAEGANSAFDSGHDWTFYGRATNRISVSMFSGTMKAGKTYAFNLLWKVPGA